jgi:hypothetical protein
MGNKIIKIKQKKYLRDDFTNEITHEINSIGKTISKL